MPQQAPSIVNLVTIITMKIGVLRPLLRTWQAKWVKDETCCRYDHAVIRTQVVVISGPRRYQLDHGGVPEFGHEDIDE